MTKSVGPYRRAVQDHGCVDTPVPVAPKEETCVGRVERKVVSLRRVLVSEDVLDVGWVGRPVTTTLWVYPRVVACRVGTGSTRDGGATDDLTSID